jgi:hypothetical protein
MKRALTFAAMALGLVAIPASPALAAHGGSNCTYASGQATSTGDLDPGSGELVVYADDGMSGSATAAAGACLNTNTPAADLEGGTGEAGAGTSSDGLPGAYAIVDGDNDNTDPGSTGPADSQSDGYVGVSNYETGPRGDPVSEAQECIARSPDSPSNSGTNSGGCLGPDGGPFVPVPLVACGNTAGNNWDATSRDGCVQPDTDF